MNTEPRAHAKFSASGSHRWIHCPGSIKLSEKAPPSRESAYAKEGTDAHLCLEILLKNPKKQMATEAMLAKTYPMQMVVDAAAAANEIRKRVPKGGTLLSETKSDLSYIHPDMWGTTDAVIIEEFGRLTVIDFKYGAGIPVDPENNSQLIFYALGISKQYHHNFSEVSLMIIQPRADHERGPIREWVLPIHELLEWEVHFKNAVEVALDHNAPYDAGEHCRFCPATPICPALSEKALQSAKADFSLEDPSKLMLPVPKPHALTQEWFGLTLKAIDLIERWIEGVREAALSEAKSGKPPIGWKLVDKRGTRKWNDVELVEAEGKTRFGKKIYTKPELLSPAQFEKIGDEAKKFVDEHSTNVSSGVTLVPESDKRPAINQIEQDFADVSKPKKLKGK